MAQVHLIQWIYIRENPMEKIKSKIILSCTLKHYMDIKKGDTHGF